MTDEDYMREALYEAQAASLRGEVPVGAVIVRDGAVLAADGNRTRALNDPTAHAEMLVIRAACNVITRPKSLGRPPAMLVETPN